MRLFLCISLYLLSGIAAFGQESMIVKTDRSEGIICTNFSDWSFWLKGKEFWTPTKEQVLKAEEKIKEYLKHNSPGHAPDLWQDLPKYKRQYVGIIVDGHKRIFCNFYRWDRPLSSKPVFVLDGGADFFQLEYDLEDRKCYNFRTNGYA